VDAAERSEAFGSPENRSRQRSGTGWRIDLIALQLDGRGKPLRLGITENAVQL
jgi:hypothetical protein